MIQSENAVIVLRLLARRAKQQSELLLSSDSATLQQNSRRSSSQRSYRRQTVDVRHRPRSGERSYGKVALSNWASGRNGFTTADAGSVRHVADAASIGR